jgi:hypothetical protein
VVGVGDNSVPASGKYQCSSSGFLVKYYYDLITIALGYKLLNAEKGGITMWPFDNLNDLRAVFLGVIVPCFAVTVLFLVALIVYRPSHPSTKDLPKYHKKHRKVRDGRFRGWPSRAE